MRRNFSFIIIPFIIVLFSLLACSSSNPLGKGLDLYETGEYEKAIVSLERTYKRVRNRYYRGEISFYLAQSYSKINQPRRAAALYGRALNFGYSDRDTELYQAQQLHKIGNYEEAIEHYNNYLEKVSDNVLAWNGLSASKKALEEAEVTTAYKVNPLRAVNSRNSDYSPYIAADDLGMIFFSSMRPQTGRRPKVSRITGQGPSQIYTSIQDSRGDWLEPEVLFEMDAADSHEDGTITITGDGNTAYFTRCSYDGEEIRGTKIWTSRRAGGNWSEPSPVDLGVDSLIYAHPAVSSEGNILYFVSDRPGGFGGLDLWKSESLGDGWSTPVNLGPDINTPGDEMFPYYREDGTLYFSSNGLPGYGGLDIFKAVKVQNEDSDADERWEVSNLGRPINSSSDDFGITFLGGRESGYFSSSRDNARGYDNIYSFTLPSINVVVSGKIALSDKESITEDTKVRIIGTDGTNLRVNIESSGAFNIMLSPDNEYAILASAPGYLNHRERINTHGLSENHQYNLNIELSSASRPLIFENLQFASGSSDLSSSSLQELDRLADMLKANPLVRIDITAHTDSRGNYTDLLVLSQKRAENVLNYLTEKGVAAENLSARGMAGDQLLKVSESLARRYNYLKEGSVLNEATIQQLSPNYQELARNLNNRVEFSILP